MKKIMNRHAVFSLFAATAILALTACGLITGGGEGTGSGAGAGENQAFDTCIAALTPCDISNLQTADDMKNARCNSLTWIEIPLADGSSYGPITMQAGPYGAAIDWNAGKCGEFVNSINVLEYVCVPYGIETFAQPASVNEAIENLRGLDWGLYTIFRPACFKEGEKYPVITWANGTCGEVHGYTGLLNFVASHGFVVIASNSTWTGTSPTNTVQTHALDYAKALNEDPHSLYYQKFDMDKIGAMGHSQGAGATGTSSSDPRIKALIFWNSGTSDNKPFLDVSGDQDVGSNTPASMSSRVNASTQPGAWVYTHKTLDTGGNNTGHLVLMEQPDRVGSLAVNWWKYILNGDAEAKKMFIGDNCDFCTHADDYEYGHNSLLK